MNMPLASCSVILPAKNEEKSIVSLVLGINSGHEVIVVDDGLDRTASLARECGAKIVKGKSRGLGQAIIDGIESSQADIVLVMDSDGQHRTEDIPRLLKPILEKGCDMVIGSRFVRGGESPGLSLKRRIISRVAGFLAFPITGLKDNTSGFFAFRRSMIKSLELKPTSWKIMLEVLIKAKPERVLEVPITFEKRESGESKLSKSQVTAYLKHLALLYYHKHRRFGKFCIVGLLGTIIHFVILYGLTDLVGLFYLLSAAVAVTVVSTNNYLLNHIWTFKKRAIKNHTIGWSKYMTTSLITDAMYIGLLAFFVELVGLWYILGAFLSLCTVAPIRFIVVSKWIWGRKSDPAVYDWEAFSSLNVLRRYWKKKIAEKVWSMAGNPPRDILDCGCGSSPIITHFPNAIGTDIDQGKLDFMKTKVPNRLINMDVSDLKFPDESFDLVLFIETIEHLDTPNIAMSEVSRVLRTNGVAIIATPDNSKLLWRVIQFLYDRVMPGGYKGDHVSLQTKHSLVQLAHRNNLELVRLDYVMKCDMVAKFTKRSNRNNEDENET